MSGNANAPSPKNQTLLEKIAGRRYRLGWDEAADYEPGKNTHLRAMYQIIPWKFGEIYQHASNDLAWYCTSGRIKERLKAEALEWLDLHLDCDGEAIFIFPTKRFPEICKLAKPKRRRIISEKERRRLADLSKRHSPFSKSSKTAPDSTISVQGGIPYP